MTYTQSRQQFLFSTYCIYATPVVYYILSVLFFTRRRTKRRHNQEIIAMKKSLFALGAYLRTLIASFALVLSASVPTYAAVVTGGASHNLAPWCQLVGFSYACTHVPGNVETYTLPGLTLPGGRLQDFSVSGSSSLFIFSEVDTIFGRFIPVTVSWTSPAFNGMTLHEQHGNIVLTGNTVTETSAVSSSDYTLFDWQLDGASTYTGPITVDITITGAFTGMGLLASSHADYRYTVNTSPGTVSAPASLTLAGLSLAMAAGLGRRPRRQPAKQPTVDVNL